MYSFEFTDVKPASTTPIHPVRAGATHGKHRLRSGALRPFACPATPMTILTTARLRLEPLDSSHLDGMQGVNSDAEVMRFISGQPETREETLAGLERIQARWREFGYSWWGFVSLASGEIVGAGCIQNLRRTDSPSPDPACPLEIGWRLRRDCWHQGLASEAAIAMADFAFGPLRAPELYAVCHPDNAASAAVMQRLGMEHLGLDTWYGERMTTYRVSAARWKEASASRGSRPGAGIG
jgi:RimJ/RimL family protein N-acetyltransferase